MTPDATRDAEDSQVDTRTRTHLASERTFLAWLRTGITAIALGLAAARFLAVEIQPSDLLVTALAYLLIVGGIGLTVAGAWRYVHNCQRIETGQFRPSPRLVGAAAGLVVITGILAIGFVVLLS